MKTKARGAKGARVKSAGRQAPAKTSRPRKASAKKSGGKKTTAKKATAKKASGKKAATKKATAKKSPAQTSPASPAKAPSGSKSGIRKAASTEAAVSAPKPQANGTGGAPAESPHVAPETRKAGPPSWGDLMHRVIDVVDPSSLRERPRVLRPADERPVGRWIAASFLAGCLCGWILAAVL